MTRRGRDCAGFTVVEILVSAAVLSVALGVAYGSIVSQMRRHVGQTMLAETMHAGRTAFEVLAQQIAMAGFGVPVAETPRRLAMLETAEATRLQFWTNVGGTHTYLTAAAKLGARDLTVMSATGFRTGQTVVVTDGTRWSRGAFAAGKGAALTLAEPLTYNFAAGALVVPIEVVTLEFAKGGLWRNGRQLIGDLPELRFEYDAKQPGEVRVVSVTMTVQTRAAEPGTSARRTITLGTRVAPANLAL